MIQFSTLLSRRVLFWALGLLFVDLSLSAQVQQTDGHSAVPPGSGTRPALQPVFSASAPASSPSGADLYNWIPKSSLLFHPNVGQIQYPDGSPAAEVKFITKGDNGVRLYFTEKGLSYVFVKAVKSPMQAASLRETSEMFLAPEDRKHPAAHSSQPAGPVVAQSGYEFEGFRMDMELIGANPDARVVADKVSDFYNNYYLGGRVPEMTGVRSYRMLTYQNVYPNIDLVFYGSGQGTALKYDFVIRPGGDPSQIRIRYNGAESVRLNPDGSLIIKTPFGEINENAPFSFQEIRHDTKASDGPALVNSFYNVSGNEVSFNLPAYDAKRLLVIDPTLQWSTYYGGASDEVFNGIVGNNAGESYTSGYSLSADFPRNVGPGALLGQIDGVVVKLDNAGARAWGTYFGGGNIDFLGGIALDASGNPVTAGVTQSNDITTAGTPIQAANAGNQDWIVVRLSPAGAVTYATYLGTTGTDCMLIPNGNNGFTFELKGCGIAVDGNNRVTVVGNTLAQNFPLTSTSPYQNQHRSPRVGPNDILTDVVIYRFAPNLTAGDRATYVGGTGLDYAHSVALDGAGNTFITGTTYSSNLTLFNANDTQINGGQTGPSDLFVAKFAPDFNPLFVTFYGGDSTECPLFVNNTTFIYSDIALDAAGNPTVTGCTTSPTNIATPGSFRSNFTGQPRQFDGMVAKFSTVGGLQSLIWGTYLGGTGAVIDLMRGIDFTPDNRPIVTGWVANGDFPGNVGGYQNVHGSPGTAFDGAMVILSSNGAGQDYGTFLGGAGTDVINDVFADRDSRTYVTGYTNSPGFLAGLTFQSAVAGTVDGMIVRFNENPLLDAPCNGVSNGQPLRIVILQYGVDLTQEYVNTLAALDRYVTNYTLTPTATTDPLVLAGLLANADVLIMPEVEDPGANLAFYSGFATPIGNFMNAGKTVIALGSNNLTGNNFQNVISNAGLFTLTGSVASAIPALVSVTNNLTPLTAGIPSQFNLAAVATNYALTNGTNVVTSGPNGVVAYRNVGTGKAVLIGADFSSFDNIAARILGNAVNWTGINIGNNRMSVSFTKNDQNCNGTNGSIDLSVTNVGPVTYLWSANAGSATTQDVSNLTPGTYTVTVTGGRGGLCTEVANITIGTCATCTANQFSVTLTTPTPSVCAPAPAVTITSKEEKACGDYDIKNVTFGLIPVPVNAVLLNAQIDNEDLYGPLPVGFPFEFFCRKEASFYISDNGFITFNEREDFFTFFPDAIPTASLPNNLVAMAWASWQRGAGNIRYWNDGTAPNRRLVIDYDNFEQDGCTGGNMKGQIIIYEGDSVEFQLQSAAINGGGFCFLTQGLENFNGTRGVSVAGRNAAQNITITNDARRFVPKSRTADVTYEWRLEPNLAVIGTAKDLTATPPNNGINTYSLKTINSARNCSTTTTIDITVNPATVGGTVAAAQTVCTGQAIAALNLTGQTGAVVRWESATDAGFTQNLTTITTTSTTYTPAGLTTTTCFRSVVQSPGCLVQNSAGACITVTPGATPGTMTAAQTLCAGSTPAGLNLAGQVGTILRWESANDVAFTQNLTTINNVTAAFSPGALTQSTCYRAVLQAAGCPDIPSGSVCILIDTAPVGGTIAPAQTLCAGTASGVLTLSGQTGNIIRWERSTDNFVTTATVANVTNTLDPGTLTTTTCYRAVIGNGVCPTANSANVCVTISPATVAGTLSPPVTVCGSPNNGTITLTGNTGGVVRWERADDAGFTQNLTTVNSTTTTIDYLNLTQTTCYRAVVQSTPCTPQTTAGVCVTVNAGTSPGTLSGQATACRGNNNGTLTLTGQTGTILRWESADNAGFTGAVTTINSVTNTLPYTNLTTTQCFRVQVQNTGCPVQASNVQCITIDQPSIPGTLSGTATACSGSNSGTITLTGQTGDIQQWETAPDINFSPATPVAVTTTTLGYTNLTQTTCYRAVVKNGTCNGVRQGVSVCITVIPGSIGGTVNLTQTVCSGNNTGNLTLTGQTGNVIRWESSNDNFATNTVAITNVTGTLTYTNLTQNTCYRAVVQNGTCNTANATQACLTVSPPTVAGTLAGGNVTICEGSAGPNITLSGQTGNVVRWESSPTSGFAAPTSIANVTGTLTPGNLTQTICYRAVVQSGGCAEAPNAAPTCITVSPATVAGTLAGDATVCAGTNPANLSLTGNTGNVVRWESSTNNFATITTINSTTTTLAVTGLTTTTCYRSVVQSGVCAVGTSGQVCITVNPASVGGTVAAGQTICAGVAPTALNLTGNTGAVVRWESSTNCSGGVMGTPINNVSNVTATLTPLALTSTTCYRAVVQSPGCTEALSSVVTVVVNPATVAGTVNAGQTICRGSVPSVLLLTGQTGNVLGWESSTDCPAFTTFGAVPGAVPILNVPAITTTTCYRAVVRSGNCNIEKSAPATVTVVQPTLGGTVLGFQTVCSGKAVGTLTLTGELGTVLRWERSTDCGFTIGSLLNQIPVTTTTLSSPPLTTTTCFRAIVRNAPCNQAPSASVVVTVNQPSNGGTVAASRTVCKGANSGVLTLTGSVGNILFWQSSTDCNAFTGAVNLGNGGLTSYTSGTLTQTTCFRAAVRNGVCDTAYSVPARISISTLAATYKVTDIAGCLVNGTIDAKATGGAGGYVYSIAPPVRNANVTGLFTGLPAGQYTISIVDLNNCRIDSLIAVQNDTTGVKITQILAGGNYLLFRWNPKPGPGVRYNYRYRLAGSNNPWVTVNNYTGTYAFLSRLDMNTPYQFQIQYTCQSPDFASKFKDTTGTTIETASCGSMSLQVPAPGGVYVQRLTARRAVIRFRNITGAVGYAVSFGPAAVNMSAWQVFTICDPQDSVEIINLSPNTRYGFRMRTLCEFCERPNRQKMSNWGNPIYFQTPLRREEEAFSPEVINELSLNIYPNPTRGNFTVSYEAEAGTSVRMKLTDMTGRIVWESNETTTDEGPNERSADLTDPATGIYLLEVRVGDRVRTAKVIIE